MTPPLTPDQTAGARFVMIAHAKSENVRMPERLVDGMVAALLSAGFVLALKDEGEQR